MKFEALGTHVFLTPARPEQLEKRRDSGSMMGIKKEATKTHEIAMRVVSVAKFFYAPGLGDATLQPNVVAEGDIVMLTWNDDDIREEFEKSIYCINGERCIVAPAWDMRTPSGAIAGKLTVDAAD